MFRFSLLLCLGLGLTACSTPYQDMGFLGGVSATQIDATTLRISGRGNGYTDPATIQNYVLLKAAEETQRRGYDVFVILNSSDTSRVGESTFGTANVFGGRGYAWGFGSSYSEAIVKPGEDSLVRMLKGAKPSNAPANVFDAAEVLRYLGPSVHGFVPSTQASTLTSSPVATGQDPNDAKPESTTEYADLGALAPAAATSPNLGITGTTITPSSTLAISMSDPHGALVSTVIRDGAASRAGIQPGDIIQMFNGHRIDSFEDFTTLISKATPGSTITLGIYRKGSRLEVVAKL